MKSNHIVYLKLICFNVKLPIKFERKRALKVKRNTDRFIFSEKTIPGKLKKGFERRV